MSEYQYYEFLAIDRALTPKQIEEVRKFSTRADISSTSFVNEYNWGDFRGDPDHFLAHHFDLMFYYANWGTRRLALAFPRGAIPQDVLDLYCVDDAFSYRIKNNRLILEFAYQPEDAPNYDSYDLTAAPLIAVREEILRGDRRPLYLGWLLGAQNTWLQDAEDGGEEPPLPAGLQKLSAAQTALADFLLIGEDLLGAAASLSPDAAKVNDDLTPILTALPQEQKDQMLLALLQGDDPTLAMRLRRDLLPRSDSERMHTGRTIAALQQQASQAEEQRKANECARKERARNAHLDELIARGESAWRDVDELIDQKNGAAYEKATTLLSQLREASTRANILATFTKRIRDLRQRHATKRSFIQRLDTRHL